MPASQAAVAATLEDADASIARHLRGREDALEARRAVTEALSTIYAACDALRGRAGFYEAAHAHVNGLTLLGVTFLRNKTIHDLVTAHEPEQLTPGPHVFPGEDLYLGVNYYWLEWVYLEPLLASRQRERWDLRPTVKQYLAGRLVVPSLQQAIQHLRWSLSALPTHEPKGGRGDDPITKLIPGRS